VATLEIPVGTAAVPEASTWAMMLIGFIGLSFAGYCASRKIAARTAQVHLIAQTDGQLSEDKASGT
jgi:hypothetical protein